MHLRNTAIRLFLCITLWNLFWKKTRPYYWKQYHKPIFSDFFGMLSQKYIRETAFTKNLQLGFIWPCLCISSIVGFHIILHSETAICYIYHYIFTITPCWKSIFCQNKYMAPVRIKCKKCRGQIWRWVTMHCHCLRIMLLCSGV